MIIAALIDYLEDNSIGTSGTDIFEGELPFDKNNCMAFQYSPSPDPNKSIPYYQQTIDIWARYAIYEAGMSKLADVFNLLHRAENYSIDGFHIYLSYANGMIDDQGRDTERRHLFKLSLSFIYRGDSDTS